MKCDIAIVGAGPYGLSTAAHLREIAGLDVKIFGEPMEFWKSRVPEGMLLRSPWSASNLSDPKASLTLNHFRDRARKQIATPIPLDTFVDYGLWFQKEAVASLDKQNVKLVQRDGSGFRVTLTDGSLVSSKRVIVATGIATFATRPKQFQGLPKNLVSHTSDQRGIRQFTGKRVAVVGGGQSALESAALIAEAGGQPEVFTRAPFIHWLGWRTRLQKLGPVAKLLYSPYDIGPAGVSRIVAVPGLVKVFPRSLQNRFRVRALRPAGAKWLIDRTAKITIRTGTSITAATVTGEKVQLKLHDGESCEFDYVL
jgi:cation diffusion facilitator CzcD-associated flavoprotein CzcO